MSALNCTALESDMPTTPPDWVPLMICWEQFTSEHQVLGLRDSYYAAHNFLRRHRETLLAADVLRRANRRFWIVDANRFNAFAFDLLTRGQA